MTATTISHAEGNATSGWTSGARAGFGFPSALWQPSLTCSLDNPLEFLAVGWIVGSS